MKTGIFFKQGMCVKYFSFFNTAHTSIAQKKLWVSWPPRLSQPADYKFRYLGEGLGLTQLPRA